MRRRSLYTILAFLVVLLILTTLRFPFAQSIKTFVSNGFIPFFDFSTRLQDSARLLTQRFKGYRDLQIENSGLRKKFGELGARVAQIEELERENRQLRSMLDFKNRSELKLLSAKVIGRDLSNWWNAMIVDRGSMDGIVTNMPVLAVEGLVGKTIEVGENSTRVILIIDENCKVSGRTKEGGQHGIIEGNSLAGGTNFQCRMTFIDRFSEVKDRDKVVTSGLGGVFPKELLIGTVNLRKHQGVSKSNLYQEISVTPAVDLMNIDEVFIGIGVKPFDKSRAAHPMKGDKNNP